MRKIWTMRLTISLALLLLPVGVSIAQEAGAGKDKKTAAVVPDPDLPAYTHWETYGVEQGLPSQKVLCVLVDEEDVWIGTDKGLVLRRDGAFKVFSKKDGLAYPVISSIAVSEVTGDVWIGTLGGLGRLSGGEFRWFTQLDSGLINDVVYTVAVMPDGTVWAATAAGVSSYDPKTRKWGLFDTENTTMHEPWCYGVCPGPKGLIYVAAWGGGVLEHDLEKGTWKAYRDPDGEMELDLFRDDGLVHDITTAVSYADDILWVGTYFGLSRFDGTRWRSWLEHDTALPSNFINWIRARGKWVWIGTDNGLAAFDGEQWIVYRRAEEGDGGSIEITVGDGESKTIETATAIAHNYVFGIYPQGDRVWLATAAGLSVGSREPLGGVKTEAGKPDGKGVEDE